jgi:hypothetical protein
MNSIIVKLKAGNPYNSGREISLLIDEERELKLNFCIEAYARTEGLFDEDSAEFAYFASVIYACERVIDRKIQANDKWTRELNVQIPVKDPTKWNNNVKLIQRMLEFLTGDLWNITFAYSQKPLFGKEFEQKRKAFREKSKPQGSAVFLFSGGLDSLIGVIDWLTENPKEKVLLASTYDAQAENSRLDQNRLFNILVDKFPGRLQKYVARTGICTGGQDTNFRSRSLAFIGNAVLASSFLGKDTKILIPENGAIALNYPITPARTGSLSTRTVHPKFISLLKELLGKLKLNSNLQNPYQFKTKGEMIRDCKDLDFLKENFIHSVSCGKRGHKERWDDKFSLQCGACIPCIFRRAAILSAGFEEDNYGYDIENNQTLQSILSNSSSDISSIIDFIQENEDPEYYWRKLRSIAPLELASKRKYLDLIDRLRIEVEEWLIKKEIISN